MVSRTANHALDAKRPRPGRPEIGLGTGDMAILEGALEAVVIAEPETQRIRWANAAACALLGYARDELCALNVADILLPEARAAALADFAASAAGGGAGRSVPCMRKDGAALLVDISASRAVIGGVPCVVGFFADVTELRQAEAHNRRLAQAIEQTSDAVIITDREGPIEYVNPAFELISGWRSDEVIGRHPRLLRDGAQPDASARGLARRLSRGQAWRGTLSNRRKNGTLVEVQASISPLLEPDGRIAGYVGVQRDVTPVRAAESALAAEFRERAQVAAALGRLQPGPTAEATAMEICDELLALPGFDIATIFDFAGPSQAIALAHGGPQGAPISAGRPIPEPRARYLYQRASLGPWAEAWQARPEDSAYGIAMEQVGLRAAAYAPIRNGDGLLGLVAAGTTDATFARHLIDHMPVVGEFAATASALLSRWLETSHRADVARQLIARILAEHAFHPVFQPIVELASGACAGYEALTRFDDGSVPDQRMAEAHAAGMGVELELACLAAAVGAAEWVAPHCWLSLNVSASTLRRVRELRAIVAASPRSVVLELTEQAAVEDYAAARRLIDRQGPLVRLAVDDAGSGFAGLRHIVELRPQFLKLDRSLVHGVARDVTRQAMVAGMARFAEQARCVVIAEGIERRADLDMLRALGVPYGQGYLLGRPTGPARSSVERRVKA